MKNTLLVLHLLLIANLSLSQKIIQSKIGINYTQLPSVLLLPKYYQSTVVLEYEEDILAHQKMIQEEYDEELKQYKEIEFQSKTRHKARMDQYYDNLYSGKKKTLAGYLLETQVLKTGTIPDKPAPYVAAPKPKKRQVHYQKIFNTETLATSYLYLEGFEGKPEKAVKISAHLYGFQSTKIELKSRSVTKPSPAVYYWHRMSYKHPVRIRVVDNSGKIFLNELLEGTSEFVKYETKHTKTKIPSFDTVTIKRMLESKIVDKNMKLVYERLNELYGFCPKVRYENLYKVKAKKFNYDDCQSGFSIAREGYLNLNTDFKSSKNKLLEAIKIWNRVLKESELENKKARVNKHVTATMKLNIAQAYGWMNEYEKAELTLLEIIDYDKFKFRYRDAAQTRMKFYRKQKARWNANHK